ncbi:probable inactive leucine-rich repeat receptor kinase At3g03770 [Olea europaea subsp. europaea]|uniref:Probable inactive leucine-rich repeat receptor kinase At3g03770 n=1 Tax=Olea europaea subsp. europaea TaxID=158383 RepID=A0A8S0TBQ7_OLEEU|nr:probable inactive leucine-rich repeat receptor kinase At3g03770 [Olea europaea subsp. europaea]
MAEKLSHIKLLVLLVLSISVSYTEQFQSSQTQTLLRIQHLLNYPPFLKSWNNVTDFCNMEPNSTLTIVCYEGSITQLHIIGDEGAPRLPNNFSIDSFVTTLVMLPSLTVLRLVSLGLWGSLPSKLTRLSSLEILNLTSNFFHGTIPPEISSLTRLQTLILDRNNFTGGLANSLDSLSALAVLSVKNNSLYGSLSDSLGNLENLRVLALSNNKFSGEVPDLSSLANLQILDLENNALGPRFPAVGNKIERIVLRKNEFTFGIPQEVQSYNQLEHLDISSNGFVGPFPASLLSLPSIAYVNIADNKFTGMLFEDLPCNPDLDFVNFSSNLLTGKLPSCLRPGSRNRVVLYAGNCLVSGDNNQHLISFCKNEALAVGIIPHHEKRKVISKIALALSVTGGIIVAIIVVGIVILVVRNFIAQRAGHEPPSRFVEENASTSYTSKVLRDARYITRATKLGALGLPAYRTFSLEELEEATNNFDTSTFIGEGTHDQMYRGQLKDGSFVTIICLKMKRYHGIQHFMPHIEIMSKLRHHHLISSLGHCFEYYLDDSSISRVFLVFEYVPNGTLRSWISEKQIKRKLTWAQRIAAVIGVAKGIQFLHTGIVPGLFSNNLKITDILLDQNLAAKICSYNLPSLGEYMGKEHLQSFLSGSNDLKSARVNHQDKFDIYDFGVMLLEIISGKPLNSRNKVEVLKDQLLSSIIADDKLRESVVDPVINRSGSDESLKTMIKICCSCLNNDPVDRPSIEDVLWNLQFASQVQDASRGDFQSSDGSPISPMQSSHLKLTIKQ